MHKRKDCKAEVTGWWGPIGYARHDLSQPAQSARQLRLQSSREGLSYANAVTCDAHFRATGTSQ